jgi:hypothetical protein
MIHYPKDMLLYIFLSTLKNCSKFKVQIQSWKSLGATFSKFSHPQVESLEVQSSSPSWAARSSVVRNSWWIITNSTLNDRTSSDPTWGWRLNFEKVTPNLEYNPQLKKFNNDIIIYEAVEFFGVQLLTLKFDVQSFDVQYLSALGHPMFGNSMLGPCSALGPFWC